MTINKINTSKDLAAKNFWNKRSTIKWFKNYPYSEYWVSFFKSHQGKKTAKVLDLGCGGGRNIEMLINFGYDVYACDKYGGMVAQTRLRLRGMGIDLERARERVMRQSMIKLSYSNNYFDIILSHGVYHNATSMTEFEHSIAESSRVLRRGGYLCFNIFTSRYISKDIKIVDASRCMYRTKDDLPMVLVSKDVFYEIVNRYGFDKHKNDVEYISSVATGKRSVLRGVLVKNQ